MLHDRLSFGALAAVSVLGVFLVAGPTSAADLDPALVDAPQVVPQSNVVFGSGWYIRGDIGGTDGLAVNAGDEPYNNTVFHTYKGSPAYPEGIYQGPGQTPPGLTASGSNRLMYDASLGAGYQINKWFRADVIVDFHQPVKSSTQGQGRPCITGTQLVAPNEENIYSTTCTPTLQAKLQSFDALVNGYVDLGTWYSVTPYVGAGVGLSFGHASASSTYIQGNGAPYDVTYVDALNGASYNQYWDRSQSAQYYNLAYAFMGGVSIDIFDHTKLDIGYRYLHLGTILGSDVATQEVRAGLRYMIDN